MRKKKKLLTILLAVCLVAAMMPSMVFAANAKSDDIVVLYTNDVQDRKSTRLNSSHRL